MMPQWVGQEEPNGCVAATLAMVLGVDYWAAAKILENRKHDDCYSTVGQFQELWARGWRTLPRGRVRDEARNVIEEYPPAPFADLHIVSVKVGAESPVYHSVVWLRDGSVLDPLSEEPRTLADYHHVGGIYGLYAPESGVRGGSISDMPVKQEAAETTDEVARLRESETELTEIKASMAYRHSLIGRTTSEAARLREALETIRNGDEPRPVGDTFRCDGKPSKHDKCVHNVCMYEYCGGCVMEFAFAALKQEQK